MKLTNTQQAMLSTCLETGAAWTTSRRDNDNLLLLKQWEKSGWVVESEAPADFLIAFLITPAGRAALYQGEKP